MIKHSSSDKDVLIAIGTFFTLIEPVSHYAAETSMHYLAYL